MVFSAAPQSSLIHSPSQRTKEVTNFVNSQSGKIVVSLLNGSQNERRIIQHGYTEHLVHNNNFLNSCIIASPHDTYILEKLGPYTDSTFYKGTLIQRGQYYYLDYKFNGQTQQALIETHDSFWIKDNITTQNLLTSGSAAPLPAAQSPIGVASASRRAIAAILQNGAILGANFPAPNPASITTPVQPQTTSVSTAPVASVVNYGQLLNEAKAEAPKPAPLTHEQKLAMLYATINSGNYEAKPRLPKNEDIGKQVMLVRGTGIIAEGTLSTYSTSSRMISFNPATETNQFTIVAPTADNPNRRVKLQEGECVYFQKPSLQTDATTTSSN